MAILENQTIAFRKPRRRAPVAPAFAHVLALIATLPAEALGDVLDRTDRLQFDDPDESKTLRRRRLAALRSAL